MSEFDQSHKDRKYFVDQYRYNCPYCNRNHVKYHIAGNFSFNWTQKKTCYGYLVKCEDCENKSFHLSFYQLATDYDRKHFIFPASHEVQKGTPGKYNWVQEVIKDKAGNALDVDDAIFYKQPTSFFTIDTRIPKSIRLPLNEADNCRVNNFLTGGSACLRKAIYQLLENQKIEKQDKDGNSLDYDTRIKALKEKLPHVDADFFDVLKIIKGVTSVELHENPWEEFDAPKLKLLIQVTKEILHRIYVEPDEKAQRKSAIMGLHEKIKGAGKNPTESKEVQKS